ncbi:ribose 5-phosphate isomerase A [Clostridium manihotivorum]|uniref:Ribose 5-phosphate isomerase A n=1 Tax=Clostridium manihotivorum TaxID=2320868 RepID=A0A3R5X033_9CLOT|nr:ribose 5-phosphate isomerase A [Clostridium manihotivorum]QAA30944.1 ribose 5-phosphate isomerase A [Clostridium manihotivorum]
MNTEDLKKLSAQEALKLISCGNIVGLGGGRSIAYLIEMLSEKPELKVKIVTPSIKTKLLCIKHGLEVLPTYSIDRVDVAFDGCDQVDRGLNALKSGGAIHTREKLIASMAKEYILLVDKDKVVEKLEFKHPVAIEVLLEALGYVERVLKEIKANPIVRVSGNKDGFLISDDGNIIIDAFFENVEDIAQLDKKLNSIFGVIGTSLFVDKVTKVIVASEDGIDTIKK